MHCFYFYSIAALFLKLHFAARLRVRDPVKLLTDVSVHDIVDRCGISSRFDDLGVPEDSRVHHSFLPSFSIASSGALSRNALKDASSSKLLAFRLDIRLNLKTVKLSEPI